MTHGGSARERLIERAAELFYQRSYEAVGVEEVCRRAKVKKGSFYHFFGSKRDLALAVIDAQWSAFQRDTLAPALTSDRPVSERLAELFTRMAAKQARDRTPRGLPGCPFGNLAVELGSQDPVLRAALDKVFTQFADCLGELLEEGRRTGELMCPDPTAAARRLMALFEGGLVIGKASGQADLLRQFAPYTLSLLAPPAGASAVPTSGADRSTGPASSARTRTST